MIDKLTDIFKRQRTLQKNIEKTQTRSYFYHPESFLGQKIFMISSAIIHEAVELQRETAFKWWKKKDELETKKIKEEVVDIWHFVIQLSLEVGLSPDELWSEYIRKNGVNEKRQEDGY